MTLTQDIVNESLAELLNDPLVMIPINITQILIIIFCL